MDPESLQNRTPNLKKSSLGGFGRSRGLLSGEIYVGRCLGRLWTSLDRRRDARINGKMAKLVPRGAKMAGKMTQDAAWLAILRPVGQLSWEFGGLLGAIFKICRSLKSSNTKVFLVYFRYWEVWFEYIGGYFRFFWQDVGLSWAIPQVDYEGRASLSNFMYMAFLV